MRAEDVTAEENETFWELLRGPLGGALRMAGEIMAQRLRARRQELSDLSEVAMIDLFYSALRDAVPSHYPRVERAILDEALDRMDEAFAEARLDAAGNALSSGAVN